MSTARSLGEGLVLRWATADDAEALADFNYEMHNASPGGEPEIWLKAWTHDLMSGLHPTTKASDFTVVVDESQGNRIVSSAVLISQTWRYAGMPFGCGRPELIATDPDYRRRGLVRAEMDLIHAKSVERGELVQAITGIPWFYRQFGYELAIDLSGGRRLELSKVAELKADEREKFRLRKATTDDIDRLQPLYDSACSLSIVSCERNEAIWHHELTRAGLENIRNVYVVESSGGTIVGYTDLFGIGRLDIVRELVVVSEVSLRAVSQFLARWLKTRLKNDAPSTSSIYFKLGAVHPVYDALAPEIGEIVQPYAWYVRVPDIPAFLVKIRPVLEARLADSTMARYSGVLRLNFYRSQRALHFESGRLVKIDSYRPAHFFDGDAYFPGLSFLQLLFGYRSIQEIRHIRPDCFTERASEAGPVLLKSLFPTQPSQIIPLA